MDSSPKLSTGHREQSDSKAKTGLKQLRLTLNGGVTNPQDTSGMTSEQNSPPKKPVLYVLRMKGPEGTQDSLPKLTIDSKNAQQTVVKQRDFHKRNTSIDLTPPTSEKRLRRFSEQLDGVPGNQMIKRAHMQSVGLLKAHPTRIGSLDLNKPRGDPQIFQSSADKQKPIESLFKTFTHVDPKNQTPPEVHGILLEENPAGLFLQPEKPLKTIKEMSHEQEATAKLKKEPSVRNIKPKSISQVEYSVQGFKRLGPGNSSQSTTPNPEHTIGIQKKDPFAGNSFYVPLKLRESREELAKVMSQKLSNLRKDTTGISKSLQQESRKVWASHSKEQVSPQMLRARAAAIKLVRDIVSENKRLERMIMPTLTPLKHEPDQKHNHPPTPKSGRIEDAHFD